MDTAGAVAGFESSMHISPSTSHMRTHTLHTYYHCADGPARGRVVGKLKAKAPHGGAFFALFQSAQGPEMVQAELLEQGQMGVAQIGILHHDDGGGIGHR